MKRSTRSDEKFADVGVCSSCGVSIQICYQTFGNPHAPNGAVLLIMGLASPSLLWDCTFAEELASQGYFVIRFDNRDIGRSTFINGHKILPLTPSCTSSTVSADDSSTIRHGSESEDDHRGEDVMRRTYARATKWVGKPFARLFRGGPAIYMRLASAILSPGHRTLQEVYTLEDMAKDAIGLLDALDIPKAHIVGMCVGGMIAQIIAIHYPTRVASLGLLSTHSSAPEAVWPSLRLTVPMASAALRIARAGFAKPRQRSGEAAPQEKEKEILLSAVIPLLEKFAGGAQAPFPLNVEAATLQLRRILSRSCDFSGVVRQYVAMLNAPSRVKGLRHIHVPTTIVHGTRDPLVPYANAEQLVKCIPQATLVRINGLGHVLHPALRGKFVSALDKNMQRSKGTRTASKL